MRGGFFVIIIIMAIKFKHSKPIDIKFFFETLLIKRELDKGGYFYALKISKDYENINFDELEKSLSDEIKKYKDIYDSRETFLIYLTKFGVWGSYKMPNVIYVNIQRPTIDILNTILHEFAHLKVEGRVKKEKLSQEEKEKLADEYLKNIK